MTQPLPWDVEPSVIKNRDWRLQAITHLTEPHSDRSGVTYPVGTPLEVVGFLRCEGRTVGIALPSSIALYLAMATDAELAARRYLKAALPKGLGNPRGTPPNMQKREPDLFSGLQQRAAAIIFAYTALEAFANDAIPVPFEYSRVNPSTGTHQVLDREGVERFVPLAEKLDVILPSFLPHPSPRGTRIWQGLRWLTTIRDRLIHLKRKDWRAIGPDEAPRWIWNHLIRRRAQLAPWHARNVINHFVSHELPRWLHKYSQAYGSEFEG